MAANGNLIFQDTNKATFVGANSNVVIDTVHASFGVGVDVNGPTSNLHVVGNAYVTSNLEVGTANLFVDTVNSRVGVGTTDPNTLLELSSATGSATITPTELRLSTTTNAGDWDTTNPWGKISFYSHDTSNGGPQVRGAIGMSVLESFGGYGRLGLFTENSGTLSERVSITHAGNVGIGNKNPMTRLDLFDTGGCTLRLTTDGTTPQGTIDIIRGDGLRSPNDYTFGASNYYDWRIGSDDTTDYNFAIRRKGGGLDSKALVIDGITGNTTINGTISYNTKQATHDKGETTSYTSSNAGQNLKTVTISADGIAHVHVTGLWRMSAFSGTNGSGTEAAYFNIKKNSTEVTASFVGHRVAKLGNANDPERWKPIVLSWSGAVSSGDTINVYASSIENNIEFNELDLNVLVV